MTTQCSDPAWKERLYLNPRCPAPLGKKCQFTHSTKQSSKSPTNSTLFNLNKSMVITCEGHTDSVTMTSIWGPASPRSYMKDEGFSTEHSRTLVAVAIWGGIPFPMRWLLRPITFTRNKSSPTCKHHKNWLSVEVRISFQCAKLFLSTNGFSLPATFHKSSGGIFIVGNLPVRHNFM